MKVVRNRGRIYYTNSKGRERKKNEKTAKQGSTIVSALPTFYKELSSEDIRGVQCSFEG